MEQIIGCVDVKVKYMCESNQLDLLHSFQCYKAFYYSKKGIMKNIIKDMIQTCECCEATISHYDWSDAHAGSGKSNLSVG